METTTSARRILLSERPREIHAQKLILQTTGFIEFLDPDRIQYVCADGNYTVFMLYDGTSRIVARTLGSYEGVLSAWGFVRAHQSHIINPRFVLRIRKSLCWAVCMENGSELPIARSRRREVLETLLDGHLY